LDKVIQTKLNPNPKQEDELMAFLAKLKAPQ
jgi:hypothetical protein